VRRIDFVFFDAGGGHRAAATALQLAIQQSGRPWDVRLMNLQEVLDRMDIFRQITRIRMQDVYNLLLRKGWTLGSEYMVQPRLEVLGKTCILRTLLPDGLLILGSVATIIEIKSQHMPESYWQLRHLYEPAVRALPIVCHVNCLTVVKSYDPAMPYPEEIERVFDVQDWVLREHTKIGVLRWV